MHSRHTIHAEWRAELTRIPRIIALVLALGACAEAAAPPAAPVPEPLGDVVQDVGTASTPYAGKYTWSQGQPVKYLGSTTGGFGFPRVCYLTRVSGKFTGYSEEVRVFSYFGGWYLNGKSSSIGVGAEAYCMLVANFTGEYNWSSGMSSVTISNATPAVCFLTAVGGEFGSGDNVYVERSTLSGNWYLFGYGGGGSTTAARGRARCAHTIQGNNSDVASGWWSGGQYTYLATTSGTVCTLTRVGGTLQTGTSYVEIRKHAGSWLLLGAPTTTSASPEVKSQCYS